MKHYFVIALLLVLSFYNTKAQENQSPDLIENDANPEIQQALEFIQFQSDDELDLNLYIDILERFANRPISINDAKVKELEELPLLSPILAQKIVNYRNENGNIANLSELLRIEGFDIQTVKLISPFITLKSYQLIKGSEEYKVNLKGKGDYNLLTRYDFPKKEGFKGNEPSYPGLPIRFYQRINYTIPNKFRFGWIAEQDPGEAWDKKPDFNTAYLQFEKQDGIVRKFLVGDYHLHFGQNLLIGPYFALGKSSNLSSWYRNSYAIRPNTSASEFGFRRGAAVELQYNKWNAVIFGSRQKLDGSIDSLNNLVKSVSINGLHRTESEYARQNLITQNMYGAMLTYATDKFEIGGSFLSSREFAKKSKIPGANMYNSLAAKYRLKNGIIFGEVAYDYQSSEASMVYGILTQLGNGVNFSSIYRNYKANFESPLSNAFAATSSNNEIGIISGLEFIINKNLKLATYADFYERPDGNVSLDYATKHQDALLQLTALKKRKWESYIRYRYRINTEKSESVSDVKIPLSENISKHNLRINSVFNASKEWRFSNRVELVTSEDKNGFLVYFDLQWRPIELPWAIDFRYAIFDTESFDQAIYAYESSLPYSWSIPPYYNRGSRKYIQVRYKGFRKASIWVRYAIWNYNNISSISSGNDAIMSNKKGDLSLMFRYKF